jgi:enoyl-CoA hydratase/carnithine racemase
MRTDYETVTIEKDRSIGFLTLNRPEYHNSKNGKMCNEITRALEEFEKDDDVRVVLIKGAGRNFCVGMSLDELKGKTVLEQKDLLQDYDFMQSTLVNFSKGTVVAVQGFCIAAGAELAIRGDITIMEEDATIGFSAINVGIS